ncbi:MAG: nitrite reductase small subunit NirD [Cytophagaceae bacterium]
MTLLAEKIKWQFAISETEVPENGGICVKIENLQIAIFNFKRRNEWYATQNLCPHKMQMVLARGMIGDTNGTPKVACPFHKKTFSLTTGECLSDNECESIKTYPVKIENGKIFIGINQ